MPDRSGVAGRVPSALAPRFSGSLDQPHGAPYLGKWLNRATFGLYRKSRIDTHKRDAGLDWPAHAETMIGTQRLKQLHACIREVIECEISGDLIDTGVWRGGAAIFMRAALKAYRGTSRKVWVADSFAGLPRPDGRYRQDTGDSQWRLNATVAVPLDRVKANFARYDLLDDQVHFLPGWFKDTITYIRMAQGFAYLVAVMDWHSRYVLNWSLSVTMELDFRLEALAGALRRGRPEIFNSDQGSQFTSEKFTRELAARQIRISMDGRGRCMDNIFIERLWRSLKYQKVYLKDYSLVTEARAGMNTGSGFTTTSGCTKAWATGHLLRFTTNEHDRDERRQGGDPVPEPLGFSAFAPGMAVTLKVLERRIRLRKGCALSAESRAGMARGGFMQAAPNLHNNKPTKQTY